MLWHGKTYIPNDSNSCEEYCWGKRPDDARVFLFGGIAMNGNIVNTQRPDFFTGDLHKLNTPLRSNLLTLSPGRSLVSQFSLGFSSVSVELMGAFIISSSLKRSGCPGFMPGLNGVTNGAGVFLFGPVPIRCTVPEVRAGVINEEGPAVEIWAALSITVDAVMGVDARGC